MNSAKKRDGAPTQSSKNPGLLPALCTCKFCRCKSKKRKIGINAYAQSPEIKSLLRGACDTCRVKLGALPSAAIAEIEKGAL